MAKLKLTPSMFEAVPIEYRKILERALTAAHDTLQHGKQIRPSYTIGRIGGDSVEIFVDTSTPESKRQASLHAQQVATMLMADYSVNVIESWALPPRDVARAQEILDKYESISAYPGKEDSLLVYLESHHGNYYLTLPLVPDRPSKLKRTFGAMRNFVLIIGAEGNMANVILPVAASGTVH